MQTNPLTGTSTQPLPVPEAPAGQRMQQLVDESGNLGHILVAPAIDTHSSPLQVRGVRCDEAPAAAAAAHLPQGTAQAAKPIHPSANQPQLFTPHVYAPQDPNAVETSAAPAAATTCSSMPPVHAQTVTASAEDERAGTGTGTCASAQTDEREMVAGGDVASAVRVKSEQLHSSSSEDEKEEEEEEEEEEGEGKKKKRVKTQPRAFDSRTGTGTGVEYSCSGALFV